MMVTKQSDSLFSALNALGKEIVSEKRAAGKKADESSPGVDPGGIEGKSTHPSAKADNGTQSMSEGARSSENEKDVKGQQGALGVNSAPSANRSDNSQDHVQLGMGTTQSATGEDPKAEDNYGDRLKDPGTSHPAQVGEEKYGNAKIAHLQARSVELGNQLLADVANGFIPVNKQASNPANIPVANQTFDALASEIEKAAAIVDKNVAGNPAAAAQIAAGYQLAGALGLDKAAAQREVAGVCEEAMRDAYFDADLFGAAYLGAANKVKKAAGEDDEGEAHTEPGDSSSGAGSSEGAGGVGGGDGGGGGSPEGAPPGGGGGGGGGGAGSLGDLLMGGGGGDGGAGGPSHEQVLQELAAALMELGIPVDQLAGAGGGGGGGMAPPGAGGVGEMIPPPPPGGGGMPPPGGDPGMMMPPPGGGGMPPPGGDPGMMPPPPGGGGMPPDEGMKLATAVRRFQRSGNFRFKEAGDGTYNRQLRDECKRYVLDLMRR